MQCNKCQEQTEHSTGKKTLMSLFVLELFACIRYTGILHYSGTNIWNKCLTGIWTVIGKYAFIMCI